MLNHIIKKILKIIDINNTRDSRNIGRELQRRALKQTAIFIEENMLKTKSFPNKISLLKYALDISDNNGLYVEFGVYEGVTLNLISSIVKNKIIYGFDSFEGLPEDWRDGFEKGFFKMENLPEVNENTKLVIGMFEDTLPNFVSKHNEKCSFIHVDCDLYSSTTTIFKVLSDKIKKDTVIVFDEFFNYPGWKMGESKAFLEFVNSNNIKFEYIGYSLYDQQVAVRILGED
ncbi:MAG: class I SAM-dependent methyltransferase [Methanobacterium sp.]|jgi:predicted O-methyltransferase YrrM|nr:class I SAM-dependent methyltransferase [Methanobacterium sp.]